MTIEIFHLTQQIQRWLNAQVARHLEAQATTVSPLNGGRRWPPATTAEADGARMNENVVLTPERILEVTEDVLRRFGLAKATVVDVARALDVSHGSVYRHFPSKASLRQAVAKRWLDRSNAPLQKIVEAAGPGAGPAGALAAHAVCKSSTRKSVDDPEMFATYLTLAQEACQAVSAHKERLGDQVEQILADGVKQGAFEVADVKATSRAVFDATIRFHHPAHSEEWRDPAFAERIDAVLALLLRGLEAPRKR